MKYTDFDHAGWVQSQIDHTRAHPPRTQSGRRRQTDGLGWEGAPETLLPWQQRLFTVLGIAGGGIYNAPIGWTELKWRCHGGLSLTWRSALATFDFNDLTILVFGCHDFRIRLSIQGAARDYLRFYFHPRDAEGTPYGRHPNLAEAFAHWHAHIPPNHPFRLSDDFPQPEAMETV